MRVLAWMRDHLLATVVGYLVVVGVTLAAAVGIGVWFLALVATGGSTGALFEAALVGLLALVVLGTATALLSLVGIWYGLYSRAATVANRTGDVIERGADTAAAYGAELRSAAADVADPPDHHPGANEGDGGVDSLKSAYVDGILSESEFEQRVRDRLAWRDAGGGRPSAAADGANSRRPDWSGTEGLHGLGSSTDGSLGDASHDPLDGADREPDA